MAAFDDDEFYKVPKVRRLVELLGEYVSREDERQVEIARLNKEIGSLKARVHVMECERNKHDSGA